MDDMSTRRGFLAGGVLAAPLLLALAENPLGAGAAEPGRRMKILCVGAHPDDPESGCAGALSRYADVGHSVTVLYLTRGERGIRGKDLEAAGRIRTAESQEACHLLGAQPRYFGQIDGATEMTRAHVETMTQIFKEEHPDVLFTHWPVDSHLDHQVASLLTLQAWMALGQGAHLYFYEVNTGSQSQGFLPNTYVDITPVVDKKKAALFAHVSQDGKGIWREHHEVIAQWRGREAGVAAAEAFVHLSRDSKISKLPNT